MKRNIYILVLLGILLMTGCKSTTQTTGSKQFKRSPIVEVKAEQLKLDLQLIDAKTLQENGDQEGALQAYYKLLKADPKYAAAYYGIGQIKLATRELDSALLCTLIATELDPQNRWYLLQLASIYEQRREPKPLIATWEKLIQLRPDEIDYYYEKAHAQMQAEDLTGSIQTLNRVEKKVGITEIVSVQKQKLWEALGKEENALKEIERLAQALPQEKKYSAILAELYMKQKNYKKAKEYYDLILTHHPDDEYIHISLAEYYKQTQQPEQAYLELKQGFQSPALDSKSKLQILGAFYTNEEFYGTYSRYTFDLLDQLMAQCEDSTTYALFYGDVLMRQEKYPEAYHQLQLHLTTDSSEYEVWEAMLICLSMIDGKEEEMEDYCRRALALFPLHSLPYYLLGVTAYQHKNYQESLGHLEQCEKLGFNKGYLENETYSLLASDHYEVGHYETAWKYFDKALEKNPNDVGTLNNYAYFLALRNEQLEKAEQMSRKTIEKEPDNPTFLDTYAWVLHVMGRDKDALPYIEKAVRLDKEGGNALESHLHVIQEVLAH